MNKSYYLKPLISAITALTIVAIMGSMGTYYASKKNRYISEKILPSISHLAQGTQYRGQAFLSLMRALNSSEPLDPKKLGQLERDIAAVSDRSYQEYDLYEDAITTCENRALYNELVADRQVYVNCRNEILQLLREGHREQANQKLIKDLLPMYESYITRGQHLVDYATKDVTHRLEGIHLIAILSQGFAVVSSILIFTCGFFLGYTR